MKRKEIFAVFDWLSKKRFLIERGKKLSEIPFDKLEERLEEIRSLEKIFSELQQLDLPVDFEKDSDVRFYVGGVWTPQTITVCGGSDWEEIFSSLEKERQRTLDALSFWNENVEVSDQIKIWWSEMKMEEEDVVDDEDVDDDEEEE